MPRTRIQESLSFGGRVPPSVGGLVAAVVLASVAGALWPPLRDWAFFSPSLVRGGEIWRLVTYPFVEASPFALLFGGLMLWIFGRDLAFAIGERRFLLAFAGLAAGAAVGTSLLALAWGGLAEGAWAGPWPVIDGLVVAWAVLFPGRQLAFMLVLPLSGRALLWVTVGGTVLFAVFQGVAPYVPHLLAEGLAVLWLRAPRLRLPRLPRWLRRRRPFEVIHADRDPDAGRPRWMN
ncbi:MAG TPA: rhomboid family intramembrane serine protease [Anaeromyxobacteraceae bacterium]|nr:rhomboid family intramembrane serine protease [Anaeromyxobacteraceae bacterium]